MLSVVAALAITAAAPAFAADMPVKGKPIIVATPSPWDIAFGTAFTTDYILRGISQSNKRPAVQGYFEGRYTVNDMVTLYAGVWGSSLYTGLANAEFDISGGARFTFGNFGLDLGYVYYAYPGSAAFVLGSATSMDISFGEFYAKPSYKFNDFLTVGAAIIGGSDFGNTGQSAIYYEGNATVTLPAFMPMGITTSISGAIGRQTYSGSYKGLGGPAAALANNIQDYTTWNAGIAFNYKAVTLDLRYHDTDLGTGNAFQCVSTTLSNICKEVFVATLKFDTTFSALK
ncbi:MAG: TorF family putative porin [Pseudolabrys sp.]|nr:TorF family putative porin [Pseudolabrys sp.]MDP2294530.1 TorF family putative porin [Pseudolabrys sp.]